jgi:hypothetical protein
MCECAGGAVSPMLFAQTSNKEEDVATILKFPQFDADLQVAARAALELAAREIGEPGQRHDVRKAIASRIMRGARMGERGIYTLRDIGLNRVQSRPRKAETQ